MSAPVIVAVQERGCSPPNKRVGDTAGHVADVKQGSRGVHRSGDDHGRVGDRGDDVERT